MEIRTQRLLLREFRSTDVDAVFAYQSDSRYLRYYPWTARSREGVETLLNRFLEWIDETPRTRYQFAIVFPHEDSVIGSCGVRGISGENNEGEFGVELNPAHWGRGLAAEAGRAVLNFGFETLELHRIWAECAAANAAAIRLVEQIGLRKEGHFRKRTWIKDRWCDTVVCAALSDEWRRDA